MQKVDARGQSCPQPVIMTRKAVAGGANELEVTVDNKIAANNVKRFLEKSGFDTSLDEQDGDISVTGKKNCSSCKTEEEPSQDEGVMNTTVFISRNVVGGNDMELGEVLIKAFLSTLAQMPTPPKYISLMNEGIKLALKGTSTCESLQELQKKGSEVLVCGTCSNHFKLTEQVGVGVISNMFDITDSLLSVEKVISI